MAECRAGATGFDMVFKTSLQMRFTLATQQIYEVPVVSNMVTRVSLFVSCFKEPTR